MTRGSVTCEHCGHSSAMPFIKLNLGKPQNIYCGNCLRIIATVGVKPGDQGNNKIMLVKIEGGI